MVGQHGRSVSCRLTAGTAASWPPGTYAVLPTAASGGDMKIVDTHQHLWDLDLFRYSWLQSVPALNRSFRLPDYLAATAGLDIEKSVHLEADVDEPYMLA